MLNNISKYVYFFLGSFFLLFVYLKIFLFNNLVLNKNLVYLFTIILIPIFDYSLSFLGVSFKKIKDIISFNYIFRYLLLIFVFILLIIYDISFWNIVLIIYLLAWFLFKFKSDLSYILSLFVFLYGLVFYIIWSKDISIVLFIYSFYLIIIGIFFDFFKFLGFKEILVFKNQKKIKKSIINLNKKIFTSNYDKIYIWIIIWTLFFIFFELLKNYFSINSLNLLIWVLFLFLVLFIIKKILENNPIFKKLINYLKINKYNIFNIGIIIYFIIFVISFLSLNNDLYKIWTYIFISLYFILLFFWYKFDFFITKLKVFSLDFLNVFIIFWSIFYLFIHKLFLIYNISWFNNILLWIYFVIFTSFFYFFIEKKYIKKFIVDNTYYIMFFLFVFILIWSFLYKNWFILVPEEKVVIDSSKIQKEEEILKKLKEQDFQKNKEKEVVIKEVFVRIKEIYEFKNYLNIWHKWDDVKMLQDLLQFMGFYTGEVTWEYDLETKEAVKKMLIEKCDWPDTTLWVFWPKAMECFNNLEIKYGNAIN